MSRWIVLATTALALCAAGCMSPPEAVKFEDVAEAEPVEDLGEMEDATAEEGPPPPEPVMEPLAVEVLQRMSEALRAAERFTLRAETTTETLLANGQSIELSAVAEAAVRRPNGLFVDRRTDRFHRRMYYDGNSVSLFDVDKNVYARKDEDIPGTITETVDRIEERFGITMPLSDLFVGDPAKSLSDYADWGVYAGVHEVRGAKCHHLAFANDFLEWQVWIAADGPPLPRKLVIVYVDEPGSPRFRAHLTQFDLEADVPDTTFTFTPPDGAKRITIEPAPAVDE